MHVSIKLVSLDIFYVTGSSQDLSLDNGRLMDMQDDAKSRRISAEVMKHRLYESVVQSPRRRRFSMRMDYFGHGSPMPDEGLHPSRYVQSLPVTPAHSSNVSPVHSPTLQRRFPFGFFSRGTTPDEERKPIGEGDGFPGLAGILKPYPATPENEEPPEGPSEGPQAMETSCDAENKPESRLMPPPLMPGLGRHYKGGVLTRDMLRYRHLRKTPPTPLQQTDCNSEENNTMDIGDP